MHLGVSSQHTKLTSEKQTSESSAVIKARAQAAYQLQLERQSQPNSKLTGTTLKDICELTGSTKQLLLDATERFKLSMRSQHRILRVSRTIADLDHAEQITEKHLAEAISYRQPLAEFI